MSSAIGDFLFDLVLDPTLLDLVLSLPDLTWHEVGTAIVTLLAWDVVSKPVIAFIWQHVRRVLSWGLLRLAVAIRPSGGGALWIMLTTTLTRAAA